MGTADTRDLSLIFSFTRSNIPCLKWPQIQLFSEGDQIRLRYIEAMKAADKEDYRELIAFMKAFVE